MTNEVVPLPVPTEANPAMDLSAKFGLVNGQFAVERNIYDGTDPANSKVVGSYTENGGWSVIDSSQVASDDGTTVEFVKIQKITDGSTKTMTLDKLMSWQPKVDDADITVPRNEAITVRKNRVGTIATVGEKPKVLSESDGESKLTDNQKIIFAPYVATEIPNESNYDYLLNPDADFSHYKIQDAAVKKEGREPTQDSLERAVVMLNTQSLDSRIKRIISKYANELKDVNEVVTQIRENPKLRYDLASYFLIKVAVLPNLPSRVAANSMKSTGFSGYENMPQTTSQEYASLLALSQLDGTFKPEAVADGIDIDQNGTVRLGQHRYAAEGILFG